MAAFYARYECASQIWSAAVAVHFVHYIDTQRDIAALTIRGQPDEVQRPRPNSVVKVDKIDKIYFQWSQIGIHR